MTDLIERLRRAAKLPSGWAISDEAADEIERLQSSLARHVDSVCALTTERDALRARIEGAPIVTMKQLKHGIVPGDYAVPWNWNEKSKRMALVVIE